MAIPAASSVTAQGIVTNAGANKAATVQSNDGSQNFVVIANPAHPNYSATLGGYTVPSMVASIIVPASALIAGAAGNVRAGTLTVMTSPVTGLDQVTNVAAFVNGADQEQDTPLKRRFAAYILGLSRGDYYGLTSSILGVGVTVQWTLTEFYNFDGSGRPGYFFVVADDGSGNPPAAFMQMVTDAAYAVRPLGIQCGVFRPTIIFANVAMQVPTLQGYDRAAVLAQVGAAIATNINALGLGKALPWNILSSWAYAVPGVDCNVGVSGVLLNGASGDSATITPTRKTQDGNGTIGYATIKAGVMTIS